MALLHRAELHPTKLELLAAWLPSITLACVGARALVRRDFDQVAGLVAVVMGVNSA